MFSLMQERNNGYAAFWMIVFGFFASVMKRLPLRRKTAIDADTRINGSKAPEATVSCLSGPSDEADNHVDPCVGLTS
jgi:hypothetical protein